MQAKKKKVIEFRVANGIDVQIDQGALKLEHQNMYSFTRNANEIFSRGSFLVFNHRQQVWHYCESPDIVDRSIGYVKVGYGWNLYRDEGQIGKMLDLMSICTDLNGRVRSWQNMSQDERKEFTKAALAAKESLSRVVSEEKLQMRWRLGDAAFVKDRLGRTNQGKSAAQLIAAADNGYRLYRAMVSICGHMEDRHVIVRKIIACEEQRMRMLYQKVVELIDQVSRFKGEDSQLERLILWLVDMMVSEMQKVHFKPWRTAYRRCIQDDLGPVKVLIQQKKVREALQRLHRVKLALECLEFEREFADWMRRAFIETARNPVLKRKKALHVLELQNLHDELQLMRHSILSDMVYDEEKVNADRVLRSRVLGKFYKRTGIGLFFWQQGLFVRAKGCFRHADAAW